MRKMFFLMLFLGISWLPLSCANAQNLDGQYVDNDPLLEQFGNYSFKGFKYFPDLPEIIRIAKPDFKPKDIGVSFETEIFRENSGKKLVIFGGCPPHDCIGTINIIVYDPVEVKAYVLAETGFDYNTGKGDYKIYGNPPQNIRNLLEYHYRNK